MLETARARGALALVVRYCGVSLIGFAIDLGVLRLLLGLGLEPAWGRLVSLACAMQVTFVLNGRGVFRQLERGRFVRQWTRYMLTNGFGNLCNYWAFVTLVSTHWPVIAAPPVAAGCGSLLAWAINFGGTRFVVFPRHRLPKASSRPGRVP